MERTYKQILTLIFVLIVLDILMICGFASYRFTREKIIDTSIKNAPLRSNLSASYKSIVDLDEIKNVILNADRVLISNNEYGNVTIKEVPVEIIEKYFDILNKTDMKEKNTLDCSDYLITIKAYNDSKEIFSSYYVKSDNAFYLKYKGAEYVLYYNNEISDEVLSLMNF